MTADAPIPPAVLHKVIVDVVDGVVRGRVTSDKTSGWHSHPGDVIDEVIDALKGTSLALGSLWCQLKAKP